MLKVSFTIIANYIFSNHQELRFSIVCDGAKLTSCIEISIGHSLNIFGQAKDTGQLIARSHLNHERYPAIGSEDGDGRRGSLQLGDNMIVYAGQNPDDANKHLFPFETRVPACYFRPYCRVEVRK